MRSQTVSTKRNRQREQASAHPDRVFTTLFHLIDEEWMEAAFGQTRKDAAVGVDNVTAAQYAQNLSANLQNLLQRVHDGRYRAQPVRRVWIEKENGSQRPLGIPALEDKILQRAVVMVLECIYEPQFYEGSYGFRPGRSAHQALSHLRAACFENRVSSVLDADISQFYDDIDHRWLNRFLDKRVNDGVIRGLINKWLSAGVMEGERVHYPPTGTPQGGVISPLLANVYLHYVLDEWFVQEVQPRLVGRSFLVRFADDFLIGTESQRDNERIHRVLIKRCAKYGLRIHPDKTRRVDFARPPRDPTGVKPSTFDFLGFTHYWAKARSGWWVIKRKTAAKRVRRTLRYLWTWCRSNKHKPVHEQHQGLAAKLRGHYSYFGIRSNYGMLEAVYERALETWRRWLGRRSNTGYLSHAKFDAFLTRYPLPMPHIVHAI